MKRVFRAVLIAATIFAAASPATRVQAATLMVYADALSTGWEN